MNETNVVGSVAQQTIVNPPPTDVLELAAAAACQLDLEGHCQAHQVESPLYAAQGGR